MDPSAIAEEEAVECLAFLQNAVIVMAECKEGKVDHRTLPRNPRLKYRHAEALHCINRDYLGIEGDTTTPLFPGDDFQSMFRIELARFKRLMDEFANSGDPFYRRGIVKDAVGSVGASLEAKLLLPLKVAAFGVPPHAFRDYFQMSKTMSKNCVDRFNRKMIEIYHAEYLRPPTPEDLKNIVALHKSVHRGIDGMFGSLDCMHTYWKNCPYAFQGSFKGKEKKASIVLEAVSDHHLFFWHASYGYAGTLNDINIMNLSPLLNGFLDGDFEAREAGATPFNIGSEEFNKLFLLVDGIYPRYSRFVKAIKEPISHNEKKFTSFQESARKDIERAFGILQIMWQCMKRPILLMDTQKISDMVAACLILHNMCVSDRVMGDVFARYNPAYKLEPVVPKAVLQGLKGLTLAEPRSSIGLADADEHVLALVSRKTRFKDLHDTKEHVRLLEAIMGVL